MQLTVSANVTGVNMTLAALEKQIAFATKQALNKSAVQAQSEIRVEMTRVFDRPTRWTLDATRIEPATRTRLFANVFLKNRRGSPADKDTNELYTEVFGGPRGRKPYETRLLRAGVLRSNEYTVPANGLDLDPYGNVPSGLIRTILSQLNAAGGPGYNSNVGQSKRSRRRVSRVGEVFVSRGTGAGAFLPRGIYVRKGVITGPRGGSLYQYRMLLKIVTGRPRYGARLRMFDIVRRVVARDFDREFQAQLATAISTAR